MDLILKFVLPLLLGYLLDLLIGDPKTWPHPVKFFGFLIRKGTSWLNHGKYRFAKGTLLTIFLITSTCLFFWYVQQLLEPWPIAWYAFTTIFVFFSLANKSLIAEGKTVFQTLENKGLSHGRLQLANIVGRDTSTLSAQQIRIAVLETMSENLSDGVIAPLFFYFIFGLPGMMMYKMINTLDSMIGYKNEAYFYFGKAAAKIDDVANFIPARVTAGLMILLFGSSRAGNFVLHYGNAHTSPNAGYPEAALAGILDCQFGGPNIYQGRWVVKPYIGENDRIIEDKDIKKVMWINHSVTFTMVITIAAIKAYLIWING
ncbi:cobalamin biosynthesis protein CobD [Chitinophaga silvatica]|uniref:Cobalamin biosynthesis protein CobD n=1 Tax=Chitinophaga silvatica TaxID=2282649 RepID=A0A3E1YHI1_9BACT|nr:adenosylcobinamide-phosphate synthase CbiB [Chitinophaga silvatica]RFS26826.1 cobalamin biosynthesis protein CobD [Chitinophaga silvatica]